MELLAHHHTISVGLVVSPSQNNSYCYSLNKKTHPSFFIAGLVIDRVTQWRRQTCLTGMAEYSTLIITTSRRGHKEEVFVITAWPMKAWNANRRLVGFIYTGRPRLQRTRLLLNARVEAGLVCWSQ